MIVVDLMSGPHPASQPRQSWRAEMVEHVLSHLPSVLAGQVKSVVICRRIDLAMERILSLSHGLEIAATDVYGYLCEEQEGYHIQLFWEPVVKPHHQQWWTLRWGVDTPTELTVAERLRIVIIDLFIQLARELAMPELQATLEDETCLIVAAAKEGNHLRWFDDRLPGALATNGVDRHVDLGVLPLAELSDNDIRSIDWDREFREFFGTGD
ncbi:MAG: hypothetical protein HYV63_32030 [Candidatus Schekmanbacteria bacterium]|nr:hypothetical protein [Candidatus Schekmanbacteria bacterium]